MGESRNMSEEMLRAAEAAVERRRNRRRQTRTMAQEPPQNKTPGSMASSWVGEMLSIPLKRPMTGLQKFSQWSAVLAYILGGTSLILAPNLWRQLFNLNFGGHAAGYASLGGGALATIGFLYVISARSSPQVCGDGALLGTVLERLVYVNLASMLVYSLDLVPFLFALAIMLLDSTLALVSFVLWYRETEGASLSVFVRQILELLPPFNGHSRNAASSFGIQVVGYTQISVGVFGTLCTDVLRDLLDFGHFKGHSHGLLAFFFIAFTVIGWLHILGGGGGNLAFSISGVFYRFIWSIPLIIFLFARQQIDSSLALFLALFDLVSAVLILILFCFDKSSAKTQ